MSAHRDTNDTTGRIVTGARPALAQGGANDHMNDRTNDRMSDRAKERTKGHAKSRPPFWRALYFHVLVAIVLGVLLGHFMPSVAVQMKPLGDAFIKLVRMVIGPVIFCTVVTGMAGMGDLKKVGRVGGKALLYFEGVSTLALAVGLGAGHLLHPGAGLGLNLATLDATAVTSAATSAATPAATSLATPVTTPAASALDGYVAAAHRQDTVGFLMQIIPDTFVGAFVSGNVLQILLVSVLFGAALSMLCASSSASAAGARALRDLLGQLAQTFFGVVRIIMKVAAPGAFGAMAFTTGAYGVGVVLPLLKLVGAFYLTLALFVLVVLGAVARACGFRIVRFVLYIRAEILIVLGTSSSEAALPQMLEKLERLGCPKPVVGLVVPAGYSFNLDGTNIYLTMAVLFIAQACHVELSLAQQLTLVGVAMLTSKGASGVAGAAFVMLASTLQVFPLLPVSDMVLLLGIHRFMGTGLAVVNTIGNGVAALVISAWERELDRSKLAAGMADARAA